MTEEKKQSLQQILRNLCETYNGLYQRNEVSFPLNERNIDKLDTIVKTIEGSYFGIERFKLPEHKIAGYFCLIIKDHPMVDGNKRLAVLWLRTLINAYDFRLADIALDELAVAVEQQKTMTLKDIVEAVRSIIFG